MSGITQCKTRIDEEQINYLHAGTGPPLVLVHGLLGGAFCWRFNVPRLAQKHSVYAVDLPGSGTCLAGAQTDCSMARHAQRLLRFMEEMELREVTVMGCSFGGALSLLAAAQDAQQESRRIRSLILAAPVNPWSRFGSGRIGFLNTGFGNYFLRTVLPLSRPVHGIAVRRMYGDRRRVTRETIRGYGSMVSESHKARHVLSALGSWRRDLDALEKKISQIEIPVLLIWGSRDGAVDPQSSQELLQRLRNSRLEVIEGAGHLSFEECPEEFNQVVMEFLRAGG